MNIIALQILFWIAYITVIVIIISHTYFNLITFKTRPNSKLINSIQDLPAYVKTFPFQPLYNVVIWTIVAYLYFHIAGYTNILFEGFVLGVSWLVMIIALDLLAWFTLKKTFKITLKQIFIQCHPWIMLVYLSVLVSPLIAILFM